MDTRIVDQKSVVKAGDPESGSSWLYLDEVVSIPGIGRTTVSLEFDSRLSFDEAVELAGRLNDLGLRIVIQRS